MSQLLVWEAIFHPGALGLEEIRWFFAWNLGFLQSIWVKPGCVDPRQPNAACIAHREGTLHGRCMGPLWTCAGQVRMPWLS